jgi:hypothetical protein
MPVLWCPLVAMMPTPNFVDFQNFKRIDTTDFYSSFCRLFNDVVCSLDIFFFMYQHDVKGIGLGLLYGHKGGRTVDNDKMSIFKK